MTKQSLYARLALPVYLPGLCLVLINASCMILLPVYLLSRGEGPAVASMALAMRGAGVLLADGPSGVFANRFGDKSLMLLGGICVLASMLILVLVESTALIMVAAGLLGISTGMSLVGRLSFITDNCEVHERGRALSLVGGIQRIGAMTGPLMFSALASLLGYTVVFGIMCVLAMVYILLTLTFVHVPNYPHRRAVPMSGIFNLIVDFRYVLLTAGMAGLVLMLLRAGRQTLFPIAGFALGLDVVQIAFIYSVSMLIDMVLFYPAGILMDSRGRKWAAIPGMALLILSIFCLAVVPGLAGLWLFALVSGFGNGITSGILLALGSDLAPELQRSQFIGIWRMQLDAGGVLAPGIVGGLAESFSLATSALCIAGIGILGIGLLTFTVNETLTRSTAGENPAGQ